MGEDTIVKVFKVDDSFVVSVNEQWMEGHFDTREDAILSVVRDEVDAEIAKLKENIEFMSAIIEGEGKDAEIAALVTALDMLKDEYMAVKYSGLWLHEVVKIDPLVENADRLTNKYKHKSSV